MKQRFSILLLAALLMPIGAWADSFTENGIVYIVTSIDPKEVCVNGPAEGKAVTGRLEIPSSVLGTDGNTYVVTSINDYAFQQCASLTAIDLPETLKKIGTQAFMECSGLTSVSIPNSVIELSTYAFLRCTGLTSVTLGNSLETFGQGVFSNCTNLTSITLPNSLTSIGFGTFSGCSSLKSVTIPNSIVSIGDQAFRECEALMSIAIPNSVKSIGSKSFYGCKALTSLTIPNSVTTLEDNCFSYCFGLTSVTIPYSTESIGTGCFRGCGNLASITVASGNSIYDSRNNCNAIIETKTNALICGCKNTIVPSSVTSLEDECFCGTGLTSITIPYSVEKIGKSAFLGCELTEVNIPYSVTNIGSQAFYNCSKLKSISIPNSVKMIGNEAFYNTPWLSLWRSTQEDGLLYMDDILLGYKGDNPKGEIIVKEGTRVIAGGTFSSCSGLTSITIPNTVSAIADKTFYLCSSLSSITFAPNSDAVTYIGNEAFSLCRSLTSFNMPENVVTIGNQAFYQCTSLASITISKSATSIGNHAFYGCSSLENVLIPKSVKTIGNHAFDDCNGLNSVVIGNGVREIGEWAFNNCRKLTTLTIPGSVQKIGGAAFQACYGLTSITSLIKNPFSIEYSTFSEASYQPHNYKNPLYVPAGTKTKYEATDGWKKFKNIIEMEPQGELVPVDNGDFDFGGEDSAISEDTDLDGNVVGNIYYNIAPENGGYNPVEGCIEVTKPTSDKDVEEMEGQDIFGEDFQKHFTGIVFKVPVGSGIITVNAETVGSMVLKVKIGKQEPFEMMLTSKNKIKIPYSVDKPTFVYIYAGEMEADEARGATRADGTPSLKIYGIELEQKPGTTTDVSDAPHLMNNVAGNVYDLSGRRMTKQTKGLNVVRMSDGRVRKVVKK